MGIPRHAGIIHNTLRKRVLRLVIDDTDKLKRFLVSTMSYIVALRYHRKNDEE